MKIKNKIVKFVCCCNLTLGARLIGFVGVAISAGLASVLLRDKNVNDYNASRRMALLLGLDWQHFHASTNTTHDADPDGRMISIIVLFYSILYLITSVSLIFATIARIRWLTIPWLLCECLGCFSKIAALIFHSIYDTEQYNSGFMTGSIIYIVVMTWWWLVVFVAQMIWTQDNITANSPIAYYVRANSNTSDPPQIPELKRNRIEVATESSMMDSPSPYMPNEKYTFI